ncbi:hypothetical protein C8R43DRAFT_434123 [Mycena crocata]|nr:hypothetical protein C8R43DRAFT_434123 [Mycena crocata]
MPAISLTPTLDCAASTFIVEAAQHIMAQLDQVTFADEHDFVANCWTIRLLLQYLESFPHEASIQLSPLLVDVTELALMTYLFYFYPTFKREHTCRAIIEPLSEVDQHVEKQGDFVLQLRMATLTKMLSSTDQAFTVTSPCAVLSPNNEFFASNSTLSPVTARYLERSSSSPVTRERLRTPPSFPSDSRSTLADYVSTPDFASTEEANRSIELLSSPFNESFTPFLDPLAPVLHKSPKLAGVLGIDSDLDILPRIPGKPLPLTPTDNFVPSRQCNDHVSSTADSRQLNVPLFTPNPGSSSGSDSILADPVGLSHHLPHLFDPAKVDSDLFIASPSMTPSASWSSSLNSYGSIPTTPPQPILLDRDTASGYSALSIKKADGLAQQTNSYYISPFSSPLSAATASLPPSPIAGPSVKKNEPSRRSTRLSTKISTSPKNVSANRKRPVEDEIETEVGSANPSIKRRRRKEGHGSSSVPGSTIVGKENVA